MLIPQPQPSWEQRAAKKRAALSAAIPDEWRISPHLLPPASQDDVSTWPETSGWFTPDELAITQSSATELLGKLASGQLKSEVVTRAFCKRAAAAHQLVNCLIDIQFDHAIEVAKQRDLYLAQNGKPMGPLHGLPISLKDHFKLKGRDSLAGFTTYIGEPTPTDSTLPPVLEALGAVFYVKTSTPTAMMLAETVNNIIGRTVNPLNRQTAVGGSSGGESALLAFKGSPLGVGSDVGGSLRIPAACTGLFTLRPSGGRFPTGNCRSSLPGQEALFSVNGPMARSIDDLALYCRAVVETQPWLIDPKCLPIPWRTALPPSRLKIAVMWHDTIVRPTPPVARALKTTVEKLKAAGHELVDWDPVDQQLAMDLFARMLLADGGTSIDKVLKRGGEPWRADMEEYRSLKELNINQMWELQLERTEFLESHLDRWNKAGIDAILCPTMPFNAVRHDKLKHTGYTNVFNVLDYSAMSFPSGMWVDKHVDIEDPAYVPLGPECAAIHAEYEPDLMHGMPINIQLVARRLEEEKLVAMTRSVLEALES